MDRSQADKQLAYRSLPSKFKKNRIEEAQQLPQDLRENPQGACRYPEENFISMFVGAKKDIRLATYRYVTSDKPVAVVFIFNGLYYHTNHSAHIAK
ncbi:MAG: hypothetical protein JST59_01590 [Actinobacteria bacterium]|nr:hypothetical protein [Actinomycetota bacterium]